jgi:hypothetical protein
LDLSPLPLSEHVNLDGKRKAELVKKIQEKVKLNIEKRTKQYTKKANKGRQRVAFELGDWVWLHTQNEWFPTQRKSKLLPRGDELLQVLERINDNAYKLDLPGEYNVSATFNVSDLSLFGVGDELDLRTNPFQEKGNDEDMASMRSWNADPFQVPIGLVTRACAKKFQNTLSGLFQGS